MGEYKNGGTHLGGTGVRDQEEETKGAVEHKDKDKDEERGQERQERQDRCVEIQRALELS